MKGTVLELLVAAAVHVTIVPPMNRIVEVRHRRLGLGPAEEDADPQVRLLTANRDALHRPS